MRARLRLLLVTALLLAGCGSAASVAARGASPTTGGGPPPSTFPSPSPGQRARTQSTFVDAALGFTLDLPDPWRPSSCNAPPRTDGGIYLARADFVVVDELHETGTDVGHQYGSVGVTVTDNKEQLTPRRWIEMGKVGSATGQQLRDAELAGRPAVQLLPVGTYFFAEKGRMWAVGPDIAADPALKTAADAIIASFRLLTDEELAAARASATPAPAPRTLGELVAALEASFARRDADALGGLMSDCFGNALENAGASFVTRTKEISDLRAAFASGLNVTVQPKPLKGDTSLGGAAIGSIWNGDGQPPRSIDLSLRDDGGRWRWVATVRLQR